LKIVGYARARKGAESNISAIKNAKLIADLIAELSPETDN